MVVLRKARSWSSVRPLEPAATKLKTTCMERGEKTMLESCFFERRWVASVIETWVWFLIDCLRDSLESRRCCGGTVLDSISDGRLRPLTEVLNSLCVAVWSKRKLALNRVCVIVTSRRRNKKEEKACIIFLESKLTHAKRYHYHQNHKIDVKIDAKP